MRTILFLSILSLLAGCVGLDDGFTRVEASAVDRAPEAGNSQFLALLGQSDETPTDGDAFELYMLSDGFPPADPVGSWGYVVCEVADIMNEYEIASGDQELVADTVGVTDAFDAAVDEFEVEDPVISAVSWTADAAMNPGEHMLIDIWGSDFRFLIDVLPAE